MKNSLYKKIRDFHRIYDFGDYWSPAGKRFTKKRSHKRVRQKMKKDIGV